jgi:hypothetical protein
VFVFPNPIVLLQKALKKAINGGDEQGVEGSDNEKAVSEVAKTLCVLTAGSEDLRDGRAVVVVFQICW